MIEFCGTVIEVVKNWGTGKHMVTFAIEEEASARSLSRYMADGKKLRAEVKTYRKKRSLDANAYAWVLMQKLAEANHTTKEEVYLQCLRDYSRSFTHVVVHPQAVEQFKRNWRTCVDLGEISVNGQAGHQLQCYYGSSTFDTKEMSVFIDGIVDECKQCGIETETPDELERIKANWNV